jgi:ADP-ribose pyrophosphatase YjhB (NUDIX family)
MNKEYSSSETKAWRAAQPQKMIVSKVVIKSDQGNVLLAKPSYKKTWQLPGGGVEDQESPETAAVREVGEELNLAISEKDLILKGTIYKQDEEILFFIYECAKPIADNAELKPRDGEITDYQFTKTSNVARLLSDYYSEFWNRHYM